MTVCRDVVVTVTIDGRENPYAYTHPCQLFAMSKKAVSSLTEAARDRGVPVEELAFLRRRQPPDTGTAGPLAFLEQNLFRGGRAVL